MRTSIVLTTALLLCGMLYAEPTVWLVHPDSALNSIQAGLDSCADNDIVLVCPGTYVENIVWPNTQGIHLISEQGAEVTIIDGDSLDRVILIDVAVDTTTVVRGFTLQNGNVNALNGAGIYINSASPIIDNNVIKDNIAIGAWVFGCGISVYGGAPIIRDNTITGNYSGGFGGGLATIAQSYTVIEGNTITNNTADTTGGGIHLHASYTTMTGNTISDNSAKWGGGIGFFYDCDSAQLVGNIITNNEAQSTGGGIYCSGCNSPYFSSNTITGNISYYSSGMYGSGMRLYSGADPIIHNCDISNNTGTGVGVRLASPVFDSCTIALNTRHGFYYQPGSGSHLEVHYCNIVDNTDYGIMNILSDDTVDATYNWWGDPSGPGGVGPGTGDEVSYYVDYYPWLNEQVGINEAQEVIVKPSSIVTLQTILSSLRLNLTLSENTNLELSLYNVLGREVWLMDRGYYTAGSHKFALPKTASGIYFLKICADQNEEIKKITIVR